MAWLDMHIHSCHSDDGQYTPEELVKLCAHAGVRVMAIADHNSTKAIAEAKKQAEQAGITLIPAVELDCVFKQVNLHLLGYWIDETFDGFAQVEQDILVQEQHAARRRIELVGKQGIKVKPDDILNSSAQGVVTGEMIAEAVLSDPNNDDNPLLVPYRKGEPRSDNPFVNFYWDYCAQGKPAYVPIQFISLADAVKLIRRAGGIPILAHPANNIGQDEEMLSAILNEGVAGAEVFSSYHSAEQTSFYFEKMWKAGAVMTCGSDFHGKTKPSIGVGCVNCNGMETEILAELMKRRTKIG